MERASKLTNALRDEQLAWTQHVTDLEQQLHAIAGNMLLRYALFFCSSSSPLFFFFQQQQLSSSAGNMLLRRSSLLASLVQKYKY